MEEGKISPKDLDLISLVDTEKEVLEVMEEANKTMRNELKK